MLYSQTFHVVQKKKSVKRKLVRWLKKNAAYLIILAIFLLGFIAGVVVKSLAIKVDATTETVAQATAETLKDVTEDEITSVIIENVKAETQESVIPLAYDSGIHKKEHVIDKKDAEMIAKLIWGEARGVGTTEEKAAVAWCVLNRVDAVGFPDTIEEVITQKRQFVGYNEIFPVDDDLYLIACDVLSRWYLEKDGEEDVGRVLPKDYLFFTGDGVRNNFTKNWKSVEVFDFSLPSPY